MSALFILDLSTDAAASRVTLRLQNEGGRELDEHAVTLADHRPALWEGLFDTRRHVRRMASVEAPEAQLAALGRFLGEKVLGAGIARRLAEGEDQRTVLVRLPDPGGDDLAAALARVPWELAKAPGDERTLLDRNVVVRAAPAGAKPGREMAIAVEPGKPVRVLLVFAEAPGSRPLAMRLERERLRDLFFEEVMPTRNVEVDVLCHGVTRSRLREQVRSRGGYHVVHWSGHGHVNALEIALDEGEEAARITGKELVGLFSGECGLIPQVVFLSACHSGSLLNVKDWTSFRAALRDPEGDTRQGSPALDEMLKERAGFTGAALDLIEAGLKQVVAMRYEVGDRYARRLARRFYRRFLAGPAHPTVDAALAMARGELARDKARAGEYHAVDHTTPVVFGGEAVRIEPAAKPSAQVEKRVPRPQPLLPGRRRELDPHDNFVGRGRELTELAGKWLARHGVPIAMIQGLAGLGKTALAAELIHLSFDRMDYVLCFQAKGGVPLSIEAFYLRLDQQLTLKSPSYLRRCQDNPMERVYLDAGPSLKGPAREEAMRNNLIDALTNERMLLVLDNFETNLLQHGGPEGYAAQDPTWDRLFEVLGDRLRTTRSRVLLTTRHKLAALADKRHAVWIPLGPLPVLEARLFYEGNPPLRELLNGDEEAQKLAKSVLDVSRGHPLILGRLADLARAYHHKKGGMTPEGRKVLGEALEKIHRQGFEALPDVFQGTLSEDEREQERAYLEDIAGGAVTLLMERISPEARRLLWVVTRAQEPTAGDMIADLWGAHPAALLGELCDSGLLVGEGDAYAFHELVGECAAAWMDRFPDERHGHTEHAILQAYGERYWAAFDALIAAAKRGLASEAGRRGICYFVRAHAYESLGAFASEVVSGTRDPVLLGHVIVDLQVAAAEVPLGQERWRLRGVLASALSSAGRADLAIPLVVLAASQAEAAEHWSDLSVTLQYWAHALSEVGQPDRARDTYLLSADAARKAGDSQLNRSRAKLTSRFCSA
jgi:hypothetical protein